MSLIDTGIGIVEEQAGRGVGLALELPCGEKQALPFAVHQASSKLELRHIGQKRKFDGRWGAMMKKLG